MPPAQFYHWYDVNLRMRMLGIETKKVAKMNEEAAVALGADILGESKRRKTFDVQLNLFIGRFSSGYLSRCCRWFGS